MKATARNLWLLNTRALYEEDEEMIRITGHDLMAMTDTSPETVRRANESMQQRREDMRRKQR